MQFDFLSPLDGNHMPPLNGYNGPGMGTTCARLNPTCTCTQGSERVFKMHMNNGVPSIACIAPLWDVTAIEQTASRLQSVTKHATNKRDIHHEKVWPVLHILVSHQVSMNSLAKCWDDMQIHPRPNGLLSRGICLSFSEAEPLDVSSCVVYYFLFLQHRATWIYSHM